jgi:CheY-like chemotaxis protein
MSLPDAKGTATMSSLPAATMNGPREPTRILVADNDPDTERLLISIGGKLGYQVVAVKDVREAYLRLNSDSDFKAAVLDMSTPSPEGVGIVRYMKTDARLMRIPIVIVAGQYGLKLITECFAAGAIAFLPKPFTTEQLQRTLQMAMTNQPSQVQEGSECRL